MEDENTKSILMSAAPLKVARGRKDIGKKLRKENMEIRNGYWLHKT